MRLNMCLFYFMYVKYSNISFFIYFYSASDVFLESYSTVYACTLHCTKNSITPASGVDVTVLDL